jgi:hypothetical protein
VILVLVAASLACSTVTSVVDVANDVASLSGGQGTGGPSDDLFTDQADPVSVTVQLEAAGSETAMVSPDGGQLTAEDAFGNRFTLDVPAGALLIDTQITMTPVASIDDLPLTNGLVGAVQFEPDGLFLYEDAILTIEPAQDVPVENQILFGYLGSGDDLHLAIPGPDYDQIQVRVPHFSGFGLGSGIGTDRAALLLKRAADHEVRIQQQVADYLARQKEMQVAGGEGTDLSGLLPFFESYYGLVVRPRVLAAFSSCANSTGAMQTLLSDERMRQLLGFGRGSQAMQELVSLMETGYAKCREEAIKECKAKVDPTILIQFDLANARQQALLGGGAGTLVPATFEDALKTCGAAFTANGQGGEVFIAGKICRLDEPFVLEITGDGVTGSMHFSPVTLTGGSFTDEFSGSGFSQSGGGTYKVNLTPEAVTLEGSGEGCVTGSGFNSCGPGTFQAKLTVIRGGC